MIIKKQPDELSGKPLISEGDSNSYLGRVIIELWCEELEGCDEPAFAWSVDKSNGLSSEDWLRLLISGLKGATMHIEAVSQYEPLFK